MNEEFVGEFFVRELQGGQVGVVARYLGQDGLEEQHDECLLAGIDMIYLYSCCSNPLLDE